MERNGMVLEDWNGGERSGPEWRGAERTGLKGYRNMNNKSQEN